MKLEELYRIRLELNGAIIKKEGFPIPSPSGEENESSFIGRCMKEIGGEYDQDQALAICYGKYKDK